MLLYMYMTYIVVSYYRNGWGGEDKANECICISDSNNIVQ